MRPISHLLGIALIPSLLVLGCGVERGDVADTVRSHIRAEALASLTVLREIRSGRLTNAIEILEQQLDVGAISAAKNLTNQNLIPHEADRQFLILLRDYRAEYPRREEAMLLPGHPLPDALRAQSQQVSNLLQSIPR